MPCYLLRHANMLGGRFHPESLGGLMSNSKVPSVHGVLLLAAAVAGISPVSHAQIEEVVVTARKRSESMQDVPIAITAFSSETIERKGISDLSDIAKYTSGLMLDEGFNKQDTRIVIRGLSPTRGRQNVAILQDDVDISSMAQGTGGGSFVINPRLQDLERVEVVKGPHSALYGRSAFNGAINYITRQPGDEFRGNVQLTLGDYDKREARLSVSGPVIAGKLSLGLNVAGWNDGGFYKSPTTGEGLSGGDGKGVSFTLKATPVDWITITGRSEYSQDDYGPEASSIRSPVNVPVPANAFDVVNGLPPVLGAAVAANLANRFFPQVHGSLGNASDFPAPSPSRNPRTGVDYPGSSRDIFRTTLRVEFNFEPVMLTSISHVGDNKTFQFNDALSVGDYENPLISAAQETYFDTQIDLVSQELRLQSKSEGPLLWTAGGLYWREKLSQVSKTLRCVSFGGGCYPILAATGSVPRTPGDDLVHRNTEHKSAYGLLEYSITDAWKAALELRYTDEVEKTDGYALISPTFLGCPSVTVTGRSTGPNGVVSCFTPGPQVTGPFTAANFISESTVAPGPSQPVVRTKYWTPRLTLDHKVTEDALLFVSAAVGKKPGGLSALTGVSNVATNTYEPEEMTVYELGAKTTWLDRRLQVNGSIYLQDYAKKQVSVTFVDPNSLPTPNLLLSRVVNAAKAEVKGLEFEITAAPTDSLSLTASYTYNDATYSKFTDISNSVISISRAALVRPDACKVVQVMVGTTMQNRCEISYSGNRLEGAPKHSLVLGGELRGGFANGMDWFVDADVRYQSSRFTSFENTLEMDAYTLADLRLGVRRDKWSVTAFVNNVFDDDTMKASAVFIQNWSLAYLRDSGRTPIASQAPSGARALLPDKRSFGIRASIDF